MDLIVLNYGQVTKTTPESSSSPIFHISPTGGLLVMSDLTRIGLSTRRVFSGTRVELMKHASQVRHSDR
ncbi:hypothetical protein TNCV_4424911 [Trichonephila clavipes]|nr:hypothetical protein TNCV_4424911 [Trichonephila clavipes]